MIYVKEVQERPNFWLPPPGGVTSWLPPPGGVISWLPPPGGVISWLPPPGGVISCFASFFEQTQSVLA